MQPLLRLITTILALTLMPVTALAGLAPAPALPGMQAGAGIELTIGASLQGRPITAVRFGDGPRKLVVVSATHGAPEANTYQLALELIDFFRTNPQAVPAGVRLYIIPALNPDGLALGTRFNAAGVDLNRNMNTNLDNCPENDWRVRVQGARGIVSDTGGAFPESEVEARLVRSFLIDAWGAIFLHSNAGLVFPAFCEHAPSIALAETYARAAGYTYSRYWPNYLITGGMHDWAGSLGIAAITPELVTGDQSEFAQNLAGLLAVLGDAEALLPEPQPGSLDGWQIPAVIYRFWRIHGGAAALGAPLGPAQASEVNGVAVITQTFVRGQVELRPALADTPGLVRLAPLGRAALAGRVLPAAPAEPGALYFAETGQALREPYRRFWERAGGRDALGYPLSGPLVERASDGSLRERQYFDNAVLERYPELAGTPGEIQLAPLGWQHVLRSQLETAILAHTLR